MDDTFAEALKQQLPGLKSKAQINAFMVSFEAYRELVNILLGGGGDEIKAMGALVSSFDVIRKATEITNKLREVPEAATSRASDDYRDGQPQWEEFDNQRRLLAELDATTDLASLNEWYRSNRQRIEDVTTPALRTSLFDAIREKKSTFVPPVEV